jgi:ABC-2 type transport system ATP-binding protein
VADYLVLVSHGNVQVAGEIDDLLTGHRVLTGPTADVDRYSDQLNIVNARRGQAQTNLLVRTNATTAAVPPGWLAQPVGLEELTLAYLREPDAAALPGPARSTDHGKPTEATQ